MTAQGPVVLSKKATAAVAATFLLMGLVVSSYGPLLHVLTERFGVSLPVAGVTISVHFAGSLLGVLAAMRSTRQLPARTTVITAVCLVGAGCAAVALAPTWPAFVAAVFAVGAGFGALVLSLNQLVAYSEGARRAALLSAVNGVYSAGAVIGPLVVAAWGSRYFSALWFGLAALALLLIVGQVDIRGRLPVIAGRPRRRPDALVATFVGAFILYVALENATGGWVTSHLESIGLGFAQAATVTSGFWLALVAGRVLLILLPATIAESAIVLVGGALATFCLLAATVGVLAPAAYVLAGFALAPIFPTGIVWLARLRPGDSATTSWLYPAASIGGIAGPAAIGLVISFSGLAWTPAVLALVAGGMACAFWVGDQQSRAR